MVKKFKIVWCKFLEIDFEFTDIVYAMDKDSAKHVFSIINPSAFILNCYSI